MTLNLYAKVMSRRDPEEAGNLRAFVGLACAPQQTPAEAASHPDDRWPDRARTGRTLRSGVTVSRALHSS